MKILTEKEKARLLNRLEIINVKLQAYKELCWEFEQRVGLLLTQKGSCLDELGIEKPLR